MVIYTVCGNYWGGKLSWESTHSGDGLIVEGEGLISSPPLTVEEKKQNANEFFEKLFSSIDYSLLLIFLGRPKTNNS